MAPLEDFMVPRRGGTTPEGGKIISEGGKGDRQDDFLERHDSFGVRLFTFAVLRENSRRAEVYLFSESDITHLGNGVLNTDIQRATLCFLRVT